MFNSSDVEQSFIVNFNKQKLIRSLLIQFSSYKPPSETLFLHQGNLRIQHLLIYGRDRKNIEQQCGEE